MKKISIGLTLMLILMLLVVGCTSVENTDAETVSEANAATEPRVLTIGHDNEFLNFTVHSGASNDFMYYAGNVYETLVYSTEDGIEPGLATSWEETKDSLILHLREGVKFIDGTDFNAEAAKTSIENYTQIQGDIALASFELPNVLKGIEVVDEYTIKLMFDQYSYVYLKELSYMSPYGMMSTNSFVDGAYSDEVTEKPLGTGPYQLSEYEAEKYYTFIKNPNYWGTPGVYDEVTIKIIPEQESMALALRTGEIDMVFGSYQINNNMFDEFQNADGYMTAESDGVNKTHYLSINATKEPLDDKNVRYAISYAIDKASIFENIINGRGEIAKAHLNPGLEYCDVDIESRDYNLDTANQLLDESGWLMDESTGLRMKDGEPLAVNLSYYTGDSAHPDVAIAIKTQMKEVGIDVTIEEFDTMTWFGKAMSGDFDITFGSTSGVPYDPYAEFKSFLAANSQAAGMAGTEEKKIIDQSVNSILTSNNPEGLGALFETILLQLNESGCDIPLYSEREPAIYNSEKINEIKYSGTITMLDFDNVVPR